MPPAAFCLSFSLTLCLGFRVTLPHVSFGVTVMGDSNSVMVEAKLGITVVWNKDDSLDVCDTPCHMHTSAAMCPS